MFWLSDFDRWLPNFSHYKMIIVFKTLKAQKKKVKQLLLNRMADMLSLNNTIFAILYDNF